MLQERLRNWIKEVAFHTHSRLDNLLIDGEERKLEATRHEGMVSLEALVWYAREFSKDPHVIVCDTDHPVHVLDRKGIERKGSFDPNRLPETIEVISTGVIKRARILRESQLGTNIFTGVEADVLDTAGRMDVHDGILEQLDVVIASLHYSYWKAANGGLKPDKDMYLQSLIKAAQNPHVDVIGHPTRDLQKIHIEQLCIEDWDEVFKIMSDRSVAFEVNLYDYRADHEKLLLVKNLISRASSFGVPFVVGLDFHNFFEYKSPVNDDEYFDIDSIKGVFDSSKGVSNFRLLLNIARIKRELEALGVTSTNLVNISRDNFKSWLSKRNGN